MKGYTASTDIRVRYGETDQMGYVYYGNYALYYEEARTQAIRTLGITYKDLEAIGIMMPVMTLHIDYYRPAYYDDLLTIVSHIQELHAESEEVVFHTSVYNAQDKKINEGVVRLAFVDARTRKKTQIPELLWDKLRQYF